MPNCCDIIRKNKRFVNTILPQVSFKVHLLLCIMGIADNT